MANMVTSIVLDIVDRVTRPVRRIRKALAGLYRRSGLDRLTSSARRAGKAIGSVVENGKKLGERLLWMGGIAAGAVWGVEKMVSGVTDLGMEVKNAAGRLSVGTTWLQEWQYVGKKFGVQSDAMVDGMKELTMRADEFVKTAGGPAAESFKRLGIGLDDLRKTGGKTEKLFDLVRERIAKVQNEAARQRIMDEIFGGQGAEQMVEMLKASGDEIARMMKEAHDRGAILSPEEIENSRKYTRQMIDLQTVLFSIQATVVGDLLPAINDWIGQAGELGKANRKAIAHDIVDGIREIWRGMRQVGAAVGWAATQVGGYGNLLKAVAAVMAGKFVISVGVAAYQLGVLGKNVVMVGVRTVPPTIKAIARLTIGLVRFAARGVMMAAGAMVSLTRGLIGLAMRAVPAAIVGIRAMSVALLTTPIGWIITAIAALAGAVYLIYRNWDGIAKWFSGLWSEVKAAFDKGFVQGVIKVLELFNPTIWVIKGANKLIKALTGIDLAKVGREWIGGLWDGIKGKWGELTNWLSKKMNELSGWMPDWAKDKLGLGSMGAPKPTGGASTAGNQVNAVPAPTRVETGGELRIVIDQEGRARVAGMRRKGTMDFTVESGILGVAQ